MAYTRHHSREKLVQAEPNHPHKLRRSSSEARITSAHADFRRRLELDVAREMTRTVETEQRTLAVRAECSELCEEVSTRSARQACIGLAADIQASMKKRSTLRGDTNWTENQMARLSAEIGHIRSVCAETEGSVRECRSLVFTCEARCASEVEETQQLRTFLAELDVTEQRLCSEVVIARGEHRALEEQRDLLLSATEMASHNVACSGAADDLHRKQLMRRWFRGFVMLIHRAHVLEGALAHLSGPINANLRRLVFVCWHLSVRVARSCDGKRLGEATRLWKWCVTEVHRKNKVAVRYFTFKAFIQWLRSAAAHQEQSYSVTHVAQRRRRHRLRTAFRGWRECADALVCRRRRGEVLGSKRRKRNMRRAMQLFRRAHLARRRIPGQWFHLSSAALRCWLARVTLSVWRLRASKRCRDRESVLAKVLTEHGREATQLLRKVFWRWFSCALAVARARDAAVESQILVVERRCLARAMSLVAAGWKEARVGWTLWRVTVMRRRKGALRHWHTWAHRHRTPGLFVLAVQRTRARCFSRTLRCMLAVWACRCVTRRQATHAHALVIDRTRRRIGRVTLRCWLVALTRSLRDRTVEVTLKNKGTGVSAGTAVGTVHSHSAVEAPFICPTCIDTLRRQCQGLDAKSPREEAPLPLRMELRDRIRSAQNVPQLRSRLAEATSLRAGFRTVREGAVGAAHSHSAVEMPFTYPNCVDSLRRECQGLDAKSPREEGPLPLRMELQDRFRFAQNVPQLRSRLAEATSLGAELRTVREGAVGAAHTHSAVETPFTCPTDSLRRECQGLDARSPREEGPLPWGMELCNGFRSAQNVPQLRSRLAEATSLGAELRTVRQVFIHNTTQSLSQERGMASEMLDARLHEAHHRVSQLEQALWSELERAADRNTRAEVASSRLWQHVKDTER